MAYGVALVAFLWLPAVSWAQKTRPMSASGITSVDLSQSDVRPAAQEVRDLNDALLKVAQYKMRTRALASKDYVIGPMDALDISVFDVPELSRSVQVSNEGKITLPLIGTIQAAGLTAREMELVLAEMLRQKYIKNPQVAVAVKEYKNQPPVLVFGAVGRPGPIQLFAPRYLIELIAEAGGFTEDVGPSIIIRRGRIPDTLPKPSADVASKTVVSTPDPPPENTAAPVPPADPGSDKGSDKVVTIDVRKFLSYSDPNSDMLIYPGDSIEVPKAGVVYVVGDVNRPGGFVLKELSEISIVRALALAEGIHGTAAKDKAKIYRPKDDGTQQEIAVNLGRVLQGKGGDLWLKGGDILFVPQSGTKAFFRHGLSNAGQTLFNTSGLALYRF